MMRYELTSNFETLENLECLVQHFTFPVKVQLLLEEHECESDLQIEVPKALSNLIPALVGAVYLDSFKNLKVTWSVFGIIFMPWIGMYALS